MAFLIIGIGVLSIVTVLVMALRVDVRLLLVIAALIIVVSLAIKKAIILALLLPIIFSLIDAIKRHVTRDTKEVDNVNPNVIPKIDDPIFDKINSLIYECLSYDLGSKINFVLDKYNEVKRIYTSNKHIDGVEEIINEFIKDTEAVLKSVLKEYNDNKLDNISALIEAYKTEYKMRGFKK